MKARFLLALAAGFVLAHASDFTGVYARIDRVVLEPATGAPERIQVWGIFAVANPANPNDYQPVARGYLYYKLDRNPEAARNEWNDLKQAAGTGQIIAFGTRGTNSGRLRKADEKPHDPDPYATNVGLRKMRAGDDVHYPPIRALLDYKD